MLYDITRTIRPTLAVWPGDTPFSMTPMLRIREGAAINLFSIQTTLHLGTHADAPYHVLEKGPRAHELPLEKYIGPAQVIHLPEARGPLGPDDLAGQVETPIERLLIRTWVSDAPEDEFPQGFAYPTPELIDWVADRGALLLGLDSPSVDAVDSKDLPGHKQLWARGMAHLENLALAGVPEGDYELLALPLKIEGGCAAPVRAVLRA